MKFLTIHKWVMMSHSDKMDMLWTAWYKFTSHYTGLENDNPPS